MISIIIPVYNVEKYIRRCMKSVLLQTYRDLEIILVDDGSTDMSGSICDEYAEGDIRIQVVHKVNGGLSSARNAGMRIATGEYIAFLDSDDFIHPLMYEIMLKTLLNNEADMVISGINTINEEDISTVKMSEKDSLDTRCMCVRKPDILRQIVDRDLVTVVQWNKLFKREVLEGIEYPEGRYHEDVYVIHRELYNCERVVYLNAELYYYVQRSGSIMHVESDKMIKDAIDGYCVRIGFMEEKGLKDDYNRAINMLLLYLHWKFKVTASLSNRFSDKCIWLGNIFQKYANIYREFIVGNDEYQALAHSPQKYYKLIKKYEKREKCKKILYSIIKNKT